MTTRKASLVAAAKPAKLFTSPALFRKHPVTESLCFRLLTPKVIAMEQEYWLRRKRESLATARKAESAVAGLIHFDLAGRYSVLAAQCGPRAPMNRES